LRLLFLWWGRSGLLLEQYWRLGRWRKTSSYCRSFGSTLSGLSTTTFLSTLIEEFFALLFSLGVILGSFDESSSGVSDRQLLCEQWGGFSQ